ncbi:nuclear transport factor 2 family protein [Lentzea sp. NPDC058450]|uniref:nuclear transport factor 2 family protein n=1 Tax=Lentzea sp. NPDC058450 TaxID=3346505 RepID=UPI00366438DD
MPAAEITQLVLHERQGRDRGWWDQQAACFWPDSVVTLSWFTGSGPDFVARSREMSGRGDVSVHRLSPPAVHVAGDRGWAEVPAAIEVRTVLDGVLADLVSYTRVSYRVERRDGRWGIVGLDAIYERDTLTAVLPGTALPAPDVARFRRSYAFLAWYLDRRGYPLTDGLPGDDRPEQRDEFYAETLKWLHSGRRTTR